MPKKGYKSVPWLFQKEIEIPEEWEVVKAESIGEIVGGGTPKSENKDFWDGEILWAVPTDITKLQNNFIEDTERKITKLGVEKSSAKMLPIGTVLITTRATVGECAITTKPITTNQGFQNIICKDDFDNYYILYLIIYFTKNLLRVSHGTTFLEVNKNQMKKIIFPVPPLPEQQQIASILSNVDNLIQNTDKLIEKTARLKKGLIQKLLTKGIDHTKFKKVPWLFGKVIEIPEEWEVKKLSDVSNHITKGTTPTTGGDKFVEKGIPFIKIENIDSAGNIMINNCSFINEETHEKLLRSQLSENDILFTIAGTLGRIGLVKKDQTPSNTNQAISIIRLKDQKCILLYLSTFLQSVFLKKQIKRLETIGAQPNLSLTQVSNFIFFSPPLPEQQQIASILSNTDEKIQSYKRYKEKLQNLKKSLMQKLLTGEVRVAV